MTWQTSFSFVFSECIKPGYRGRGEPPLSAGHPNQDRRMRKTTIALSLLAVTLVVTNGWWAYRLMEAGVSYTYQGVSLELSRESLSRALAIIEVPGACDA